MITLLITLLILGTYSAPVKNIPRLLKGINLAGFEFGINEFGKINPSGQPVPPPKSQITHFAAQGVNLFRIPFGWNYMQPKLNGPLDPTYFRKYDEYVKAALQVPNGKVIIDLVSQCVF